ncbi:MAG: helicase-related protein [Candidatus Coproplasma sp.]
MQLKRKNDRPTDELVELFNKTFINKRKVQDRVPYPVRTSRAEGLNDSAEDGIDLDLSSFDLSDADGSGAQAHNVDDGLVLSLNVFGRVDIGYISDVTGKPVSEVVQSLQGSIFQNPEKFGGDVLQGWETADEYLSGNIGEKLRVARHYNRLYNGYFTPNVNALEGAMPRRVDFSQVHITVGTPWIPVDVMQDFICYLLGIKVRDFLIHDGITGSWEIRNKCALSYMGNFTRINVTYGTNRIDALHIIERMLNMQTVRVTDTVIYSGKKKSVVNEKETLLALHKQRQISDVFSRWILSDDDRRDRLQRIYEDKYCSIRTRQFDGSFLTFPTLNKSIELYPYQKNAVARILFTPNTLLAHDVGAGKTYIMIAAGMELKRMGISHKNMYVIPNNIVGQWADIYAAMYPHARVLKVTPSGFTPAVRQAVLKKIRDEEWDAILIAYSCFSLIPMSRKYVEEDYRRQIGEIEQSIENGHATRAARERIRILTKELKKYVQDCAVQAGDIGFDELSVNTLFVDEAHNFKNVPFETKTGGVLGIAPSGSGKCRDMLNKVLCVQRNNNGRGVVFATGTPITNSLSDLFVIQKYLQGGILESLNIGTFDAWVANFAELVSEFEVNVDTSGYRMARRFSRFHNLPELTTILSLIADFHPATCSSEMPEFNGYTDFVCGKTKALEEYVKAISVRADAIRNHTVSMKDDNMLKITTDGRKAALDVRLVNPKAKFTTDCKIAQCARTVADVYNRSYSSGATQLIFCDSSTPKEGFNAYDEMKRLLVIFGIPEGEIAFVHDAVTDSQREKLFARMRNGQIRILLGSTWKLGTGVNVQDRLIAVHHLDVPWRPADMVQREGRILRPGNLNRQVYIYRYITEGTFDAYSWQLLETKQRFISKLLSGSVSQRKGRDVSDTVLNYAEVKALALGNPLVKERVETANRLSRLLTLQKRREELKLNIASQIQDIPEYIADKDRATEACLKDIADYAATKVAYTREQLKQIGKTVLDGLSGNDYEPTERQICEYQGFRVILPAGMLKSRPYLLIERNGRYELEYKITDIGIMQRINNLLEGLPKRLQELRTAKSRLEDKLAGLKAEFARQENYGDEIAELVQKLNDIDVKLGVKKND